MIADRWNLSPTDYLFNVY